MHCGNGFLPHVFLSASNVIICATALYEENMHLYAKLKVVCWIKRVGGIRISLNVNWLHYYKQCV